MKKTYYERNKKKILKKLRDKYQQDEEYRNKIKERYKKKYHEDESYRNATVERAKAKYVQIKDVLHNLNNNIQ
ncbi:MAG: hypothetical protein KIT33_07010 [Candidatus Kapabacteria bacterium]|nr:hypothetical protein [Ignavibacteriota bacterium]MCW5884703.1 hypothetical protein [Candidatus Kapabacteria bacterium]